MRTLVLALSLLSVPAYAGDCTVKGQALGDWVEEMWVAISNVKPTKAQVAAAKKNGATAVWNYPDGWGWNRTDFFSIEVTLPEGLDPRDVLDRIRDKPTTLGSRFKEWVSWRPAGRKGRKKGEIVDLNIWGPDNGAITYLDVDTSDGEFMVMTVENGPSGTHPVSGARQWGYIELDGGNVLFFTVGIESANTWGSGGVGSVLQAGTWGDLMRDIGKFVERKGGQQHRVFKDSDWQPSDLKPGSNTKADVDHPGEMLEQTIRFLDAIEEISNRPPVPFD